MNVPTGSTRAQAVTQPVVIAQAQTQPLSAQQEVQGLAQLLLQLHSAETQHVAGEAEELQAQEPAPAELHHALEQALEGFPAFVPALWTMTEPAPVRQWVQTVQEVQLVQNNAAMQATHGSPTNVQKAPMQVGATVDAGMTVSEPSPAVNAVSQPPVTAAAQQPTTAALPLPPVAVNKAGQPLVQALAQRIQLQQVQGAEVATVRLDPPQMGSLEIRISHSAAGAVQVHMQASNAEVGRQLTTLVETLRQELQLRSADAQVTVAPSRSAFAGSGQGDGARQQQAHQQQEAAIGQALQAWDGKALI